MPKANTAPAKAPKRPKSGRPTLYRKEYDEQARKLCLLGATSLRLADFFEVTEQTLLNWLKRHPSLRAAVKAGRVVADANVANGLYHRAIGYEHDDVDIRVIANEVVMTKVRKYYPPDTQAAVTWLERRDPERWRKRDADEGDENAPPPVQVVIEVKSARLRPDDPDADAQ